MLQEIEMGMVKPGIDDGELCNNPKGNRKQILSR